MQLFILSKIKINILIKLQLAMNLLMNFLIIVLLQAIVGDLYKFEKLVIEVENDKKTE